MSVLIVVLAAVGAFFGVSALTGSGGDLDGAVDECRIAPDGALTASGTVTSEEELDTTLEIRFANTAEGTEVDTSTVEVTGAAGEEVPWRATGQAPDDVNRVTCSISPTD